MSSTSSYDNRIFLHSDIRHNASILDALLKVDPTNPLIPKLTRGLLDGRKNGRWYNTQDNAFALIAMHTYYGIFEKIEPNFLTDMWVGESYAGRHEFLGRSADVHRVDVPMSYLVKEKGDNSVTLKKSGQGRLYYRIAVDYSPKELFLPPRNCGFEVTRTYHAVDNKEDVVFDVDKQGRSSYTIKAGSKVQIKLVLVATSSRTHVALVDYLPAGLEPQYTNTARSGTYTGLSFWHRFWNHQNVRDSRVEVFIKHLYPGLYTYIYTVRAITAGKFVAPPTKAEEMYSPDVYGRSEMLIVHVQ